jgi:hypothetical protein
MAIDPSIGMGFAPTQSLQQFPQQAIALNQLGQQQRKQQAVLQLAQIPGMFINGQPTDGALIRLSQIDPTMAQQFADNRAQYVLRTDEAAKTRMATLAKMTEESDKETQDMYIQAISEARSANTPEEATQKYMGSLQKAIEDRRTSGRLRELGMNEQKIKEIMGRSMSDAEIYVAPRKEESTALSARKNPEGTPQTVPLSDISKAGPGGPEIKPSGPGEPIVAGPIDETQGGESYAQKMARYQRERDKINDDSDKQLITPEERDKRLEEVNQRRIITEVEGKQQTKVPDAPPANIKDGVQGRLGDEYRNRADALERKAETYKAMKDPYWTGQAKEAMAEADKLRLRAHEEDTAEQRDIELQNQKEKSNDLNYAIAQRDKAAPGSERRKIWDAMINKLTTHPDYSLAQILYPQPGEPDKPPLVVRAPQGGGKPSVTPITGAEGYGKGGSERPIPEAERKAALNYSTMKRANDVMEAIYKRGTVKNIGWLSTVERDSRGYLSAIDRTGRNSLLTEDQQQLYQAARSYLEGAGHLKSGARITNENIKLLQEIYIPMPSDGPGVIEQKRKMRETELQGARVAAGRALTELEREQRKAKEGPKNTKNWGWKEDEEKLYQQWVKEHPNG